MAIDPDSPLYPAIDPTLLPAVPGVKGPRGVTGPTGPEGPRGQNLTILGVKSNFADLIGTVSDPQIGDAYLVSGEVYVWVGYWENIGDILGPTGPAGASVTGPTGPEGDRGPIGPIGVTGPQGPAGARGVLGPRGSTGPSGPIGVTGPAGIQGVQGDRGLPLTILGTLATPADLPLENLVVNTAYMVSSDKNLYVYDGSSWDQVGRIIGLDGPIGPQGNPGFQGPTGSQGPLGPRGLIGATGPTGPVLTGNLFNIDSINDLETLKFLLTAGGSTQIGELAWNNTDKTLEVQVSNNVTLQLGQEQHLYVHNNSGSTIPEGRVVYSAGSSDVHGHLSIAPFIADGSVDPALVLGITTEAIAHTADGFVTSFGTVRNLDTSAYNTGTSLYASDSVAGGFRATPPPSPGYAVAVAIVTVSNAIGQIFVKTGGGGGGSRADQVTYANDVSGLESTNVKAALDELTLRKADISALSSNVNLYPTTVVADVATYFKLVSSLDDELYNNTAADVPTGVINSSAQLVSSLVSEPNIFTGNPGAINVSVVGNIRKTAGNSNSNAKFYFEVYRRSSAGVETLVGTSDFTDVINPETLNVYEEFSTVALVSFGSVSSTDRIVLKFYGEVVLGTAAEYDFQFGGSSPVRALLPVPVSVIPTADASGILVDTANFDGILQQSDTTVQAALDRLDDLDALPTQTSQSGRFLSTNGTTANWEDINLDNIVDFNTSTLVEGDVLAYDNASGLWINTQKVGPAGDTGPAGPVGATWQGQWDVLTAYVIDDLVQYEGSTYIAIANDTGTVPGTDPLVWELVAASGAQGVIGPAGTVAVGTVTTGLPDDPAAIANVGTSTEAILDFTLPRGSVGPAGADSVVPGPVGPRGAVGALGPTGPQGVFFSGPTEPTPPDGTQFAEGTAWFNTDTAKTSVYYEGVFVDISGNVGPQGPRGAQSSFSLSQSWWLGV